MSKLTGRAIADSSKIQSLISQLVAEVTREEEALGAVRPPSPASAD